MDLTTKLSLIPQVLRCHVKISTNTTQARRAMPTEAELSCQAGSMLSAANPKGWGQEVQGHPILSLKSFSFIIFKSKFSLYLADTNYWMYSFQWELVVVLHWISSMSYKDFCFCLECLFCWFKGSRILSPSCTGRTKDNIIWHMVEKEERALGTYTWELSSVLKLGSYRRDKIHGLWLKVNAGEIFQIK